MKKLIYLFVLTMLVSGCVTISLKDAARKQLGFVPYANVKYEEKADTYPIDLFFENSKPIKPYDVIGEINGDVYKAENIRPMLEAKARQVGGDGVIDINIKTGTRIEGGTTYYSGNMAYGGPESVQTNEIKAKIVKYK